MGRQHSWEVCGVQLLRSELSKEMCSPPFDAFILSADIYSHESLNDGDTF